MDTIYMNGLEIFAYHGVNPEEKQNGQSFLLDLALKANLEKARNSDCLEDTVNYAAVRKTVQRAFTEKSYDLIERAAQVVCEAVLEEYPAVQEIILLLKKPNAPMNAKFNYVAVELQVKR